MKRLALLGVGSPFSDDTLGWELLDALEHRGLDIRGSKLSFTRVDRPGLGLLSYLEDLDAAVILDALQSNGEPGALHILEARDLEWSGICLSGHALGVGEALALGEKLGMLPRRLYLLGIEMGARMRAGMVDEAADLIEGLFRSIGS